MASRPSFSVPVPVPGHVPDPVPLAGDEVLEVLARAVEQAALAAHPWSGKGDAHAADEAATAAMRRVFTEAPFVVRIVIGEGERDEAPLLARGECLGGGLERRDPGDFGNAKEGAGAGDARNSRGAEEASTEGSGTQVTSPNIVSHHIFDCAVDPLDGTSLLKKGRPGAITVAVLADAGGIMGAPDFYMEKLVCPGAARGRVRLTQSPRERVEALGQALNKPLSELKIAVQERPRHERLVAELRAAGAQVHLFAEGDVTIGLEAAVAGGDYDALMGIGAAPEGIIKAAAVRCLGGHFEGRFVYDPAEAQSGLIGSCLTHNRNALLAAGIHDPDAHWDRDALVSAAQVYVALCGITGGSYLEGVTEGADGGRSTTACLMRSDRPGRFLRKVLHTPTESRVLQIEHVNS